MSHLQRFRELEAQGIDILALLAGDRALDDEQLQGILEKLGPLDPEYHSDLMELLTHRRFDPEQAQDLWRGILRHKKKLENKLERSVGVRVAAADYLTNRRPILESPRIVPRSEMDQLVSQVSLDPLTGLFNRRSIDHSLRLEMQRTRRYGGLFTVLLIDLDEFKRINDEQGHVAGDEALVEVSQRIQAVSRETDILGRWGGDELILILPQTSAADAKILTGRLRHDIRQRPIVFRNGQHWNATISVGIASYPDHGKTVQDLLAAASSAVRQAKRSGRDTETIADSTGDLDAGSTSERRWSEHFDEDDQSGTRDSDR